MLITHNNVGIPVGTLAIGAAGATNAALLAASILATKFPSFVAPLDAWRKKQTDDVADSPSDNPAAHSLPSSAQPVASILSAATRAAPVASHAATTTPVSQVPVSIPPPTTSKLVWQDIKSIL